jgi:hypothetical protein
MKSIHVRLPDDLHAQLIEQAETDRRSLNAEIQWLLAEALTAKEGSS